MKKALITGISGFAGSHLAELLVSRNIKVTGFLHPGHPATNVDFLKEKLSLQKCDILQKKEVQKLLKQSDFDYVFHLAAFSSPLESFIDPEKTVKNNVIGELNLLESLSNLKSKAKILIVGSAEEYGSPKTKSVNENTLLSPESPYAVSKVAQDLLGYQFFLHENLQIIRVRPFNHIGPRQSKSFVVSAYASQIAKLEKKGSGQMKVGNLNSWRDFTDVRDMVKAYLLALEIGISGEVYNLGSAKAYKIEDILNTLLSFTKAKIEIITDKSLIRKGDNKKIVCDYSKFKKQTGWQPRIPIFKTLFDTIEYERQILN